MCRGQVRGQAANRSRSLVTAYPAGRNQFQMKADRVPPRTK